MSNYSTANQLFEGVVHGCLQGQQDRVDALNERIQSRQFPDTTLRPNYDPRPVPTKYSLFPIVDRRKRIEEPLQQYNSPLGNSSYPSMLPGPCFKNVDTETVLRNQTIALQHGAEQGVYVPSSRSDLFQVPVAQSSIQGEQPFPNLFSKLDIQSNMPAIANQPIGKSEFFNHTRTQLRNTIHN
jgi:hypothetical protein